MFSGPGENEKMSFDIFVVFFYETFAVFPVRIKKFERIFLKRNFSSKRSCGHEKCCFDITADNLSPKVPNFLFRSPKIGLNSKRSQKEQFFSEGTTC